MLTDSVCGLWLEVVLQGAAPPPYPSIFSHFSSAGLGWSQKHLEVFSVAALWGTWRHSCAHSLEREGREEGEGVTQLQQQEKQKKKKGKSGHGLFSWPPGLWV